MVPQNQDTYVNFVEHLRYGRGPRFSGLNPKPYSGGVSLHWNSKKRIPKTAIAADLQRQTPATYVVTHYFDVERTCDDCNRHFIFFAQQQKHWYEELGFPLDSDCIRCFECRKRLRGIAGLREVYESLYHIPDRTVEQSLQMAEAALR